MVIRESEFGDKSSRVGLWTWNAEGREVWPNDDYPTRAEAIAEGLACGYPPSSLVVAQIGEAEVTVPDAADIIERVTEWMCDDVGEVADDWLYRVPQEAQNELSDAIAKLFGEWLTRHNLWPGFWRAASVEPVDAIQADEAAPPGAV